MSAATVCPSIYCGVEVDATLTAHIVDRYDIGVLQMGCGLGLVLETLQLFGIERCREWQDLEGHPAA
jgi:hypothetical protein